MSNTANMFARVSSRRVAEALSLAAGLLLGACDQPKLPCAPANGAFAIKYVRKEGMGTCAEIKGDVMTLHPYSNGGPGMRPDNRLAPVGMRSERLGNLVVEYKGEDAPELNSLDLSSVGRFVDTAPGDDGFCHVADVTPSKVTLDAVPADPMNMKEALPPTSIQYDWSNLQIYVTARNNGTQFSADLSYTQDGCKATYAVRGLFPVVPCEGQIEVNGEMKGTGLPDDTLCSPCADPSMKRALGSGISPDVATTCDPATLTCVPLNETPSLLASSIKCM